MKDPAISDWQLERYLLRELPPEHYSLRRDTGAVEPIIGNEDD